MKRLSLILCAVLLVPVCAAFAQAQDAPTVQCRALDALGNPIPKALIQAWISRGSDDSVPGNSTLTTTDDEGKFTLPQSGATVVRLMHADYGTAESRFDYLIANSKRILPGTVTFPLVKKGSDAEPRTLRGVVINPENQPVAGAKIELIGVTDPGAERGTQAWGIVFTDKAGRFSIYPVFPATKARRDALIPEGSTYGIHVLLPDYSLFPNHGSYKNSAEAVIHLDRAEWPHHFVFVGPDGQPLTAAELAEDIQLFFYRTDVSGRTQLPQAFKSGRVQLAPGCYQAIYFYHKSARMPFTYPLIELKKDTPEELVFRFPPPVTYAGRVVEGMTGKPLAGAFVLAETAQREDNLAKMDVEQWQALHALPAAPALDDPAIEPLCKQYGVGALVRTDADGRYTITQPSGEHFHDVIAFDEGLLPFCIRAERLPPDERGRAALCDAPLFPAAKVLVTPLFRCPDPSTRLQVIYDWRLEKEDRPEWFARFPKSTMSGEAYVERVHQLGTDETQPLYVPAGLRFRLEFTFAYSYVGGWTPYPRAETLLLKAGEIKKLEDLTFAPPIRVCVRVVDARGKPLEGIPVRRLYDRTTQWSQPPRKTDAEGLAECYVVPGSSGRVGMVELQKQLPASEQSKLEAAFSMPADAARVEPFIITLTEGQIQQLSKQPLRP